MAPALKRHCVAVTRGTRFDDVKPSSIPEAMSDRCAAPEGSSAWRHVVCTEEWSTSPTRYLHGVKKKRIVTFLLNEGVL